MATTINFETPSSSTSRPVGVKGTVARNTLGHLTITIDVTNSSTPAKNHSSYREINFDNIANPTALAINASYTLSVVPKLTGADTITAKHAWSYE